jgi:acyl carrier protein
MIDKIIKIMSKALGLMENEIDDELSPETSAEWDSFNHVSLVLALEKAFNIKFSSDEIGGLLCLKSIMKTINNKVR